MLLTVLGCSGSVPGPDSPASGYLVRAAGTSVVLDLGNGALGALQHHLDPFEVSALLLSHLHADHCADVAGLTVYRRYHPRRPHARLLPLHGPSDIAERLVAAYATDVDDRLVTDLTDVFAFHPYGPPVEMGPLEISTARVDHPCEAYALRITEGGRSLVYSGDTGPCDALVRVAEGADLLLVEASWPHDAANPVGVHLSGRQAGEAAAAAGVGRLVITHVPPWTDAGLMLREAREVFDGPAELARAGAHYDV